MSAKKILVPHIDPNEDVIFQAIINKTRAMYDESGRSIYKFTAWVAIDAIKDIVRELRSDYQSLLEKNHYYRTLLAQHGIKD